MAVAVGIIQEFRCKFFFPCYATCIHLTTMEASQLLSRRTVARFGGFLAKVIGVDLICPIMVRNNYWDSFI